MNFSQTCSLCLLQVPDRRRTTKLNSAEARSILRNLSSQGTAVVEKASSDQYAALKCLRKLTTIGSTQRNLSNLSKEVEHMILLSMRTTANHWQQGGPSSSKLDSALPAPVDTGVHSPAPGDTGLHSPAPGDIGLHSPAPVDTGVHSPAAGNTGLHFPAPSDTGLHSSAQVHTGLQSSAPVDT